MNRCTAQPAPSTPHGRRLVVLLVCCMAVTAAGATRARALITPATVVDGPSPNVLGVGNAALAPDGSGGVVWRGLSGGVPHIFVSQFLNGHWSAPIQADVGQPGPATFPAIAAGDSGELLVVWVQPWASISTGGQPPTTHYQLMSAVMEPGSDAFQPAVQVDPNDVGDGSGVCPSLAMAPDGNAYVVYRVVTDSLSPDQPHPPGTIEPMRPGDELVDVRVARFNGLYWQSLGTVNRLPGQVTLRKPSASNAPHVAVDRAGDAVVVWQEPSIDGVARIWARRIFGSTLGYVLSVSPDAIGGKPVTVDADAPSVALGNYGGAEVAFRLAGGAGSPLGAPQVLVNSLPSALADNAQNFLGAKPVGGGSAVGMPSVATDDTGAFQTGFTADGESELVSGTGSSASRTQTLGGTSGDPVLATLDPDGGGAEIWPGTSATGLPVLDVRQTLPDGGWQTASLSAPTSGPIGSLTIGPSGVGDALIAFEQGLGATAQVAVATVQAPPHRFFVLTPIHWVKPQGAAVTWDQAPEVIGSVSYSIYLDGREVASGLYGGAYQFSARGLGDGVHQVQVLAVDTGGQATMSVPAQLNVDANPPTVMVRRLAHRRVKVKIRDRASGVSSKRTWISFGDRTRVVRHKPNALHVYAHPGRYLIVVHCADRAHNRAVYRLWVVVS